MELQKLNTLSPEIFRDILKTVQKETKVNGKGLYLPIRIALTGREHGPELYSIADILGINVCKAKIGQFLLVKNK
jgi:glutamyl/glutaminyl-tRNA synthetase